MKKKIVFILITALLLGACRFSTAPSPTSMPVQEIVLLTETATQPSSTQTSAPSPSPTVTATSTPDFSIVGLPAEKEGERVFDFVEQMCAAEWFTRGQQLSCPGDESDASAGYVMRLDSAFQGLPSNIHVLLTYAPQNRYQTLSSKYPPFAVQKGDRFRTVLACRKYAFCDVEFVLDYFNVQGRRTGLKQWHYIFTDAPLVVDYPLDAIAGTTVQFDLAVSAYGDSSTAYAIWIAPHIYRPAP